MSAIQPHMRGLSVRLNPKDTWGWTKVLLKELICELLFLRCIIEEAFFCQTFSFICVHVCLQVKHGRERRRK